ncbi:MAG: bifunctional phosphoribosylaminoimidazolecarboxamide formyltransferase/IMP cyclohydrolase, partial [Clostridia bacterium]|nr:bifunctional phosphoribosylaminoimidazolecarboxamide formyltransferase/IMP cyclohydrolase [Clostridia bacterium]
MKKRALVSVSDKAGIVDFCKGLVANGFEIISTGGTAKALKDAGLEVIGISDITGFPECLDGRVKTLHPNVHAGLLAMRSNKEHMAQLEKLNINTIDIVCVNLYPFKATLQRGADFAECIENIDIGGPTMIRAAAKNYQDVAVIVDPKDYNKVLDELANGGVTLETKKYLQYKVFAHTAVYDSLISNYLASQLGITFPDEVTFAYEKAQDMRYGENPQQNAVFYNEQTIRVGSLSSAKQLWGKELSYNNINDANGALELLKEFGDTPAVVACKHANPCGVGTGKNIYEAYMRAYNSDPVSVFGGILAINGTVDEDTASEINKIFIEIVMAPAYTDKALEVSSQHL